jgi:predicted enzyme related to lactoylglutathione lyase
MALGHVSHVTIYVNDQQVAKDFYAGKLGFEVTSDQEFGPGMRWLTVRPEGGQTNIALWRGDGPEGGRVGGFTGLVLACSDLDATYEDLAAKGVSFPEPPKDVPWGRDAMLADPDGNLINVVQARGGQ